jgi:hypothetical protein
MRGGKYVPTLREIYTTQSEFQSAKGQRVVAAGHVKFVLIAVVLACLGWSVTHWLI